MLRSRPHRIAPLVAIAALVAATALPAHAAEVLVQVRLAKESAGMIGCSLFTEPTGFPMDVSRARQVWVAADPKGVTCRFDDVADGEYAVAVHLDTNGDRKLDVNLFGMPTEAWGVSNNVRPSMRAPRFDEARFKVSAGKPAAVEIQLSR